MRNSKLALEVYHKKSTMKKHDDKAQRKIAKMKEHRPTVLYSE